MIEYFIFCAVVLPRRSLVAVRVRAATTSSRTTRGSGTCVTTCCNVMLMSRSRGRAQYVRFT